MDQFCLCGAQPGYLHAADCPYPLFRATEQQAQQWEANRQWKEAQQLKKEYADEGWDDLG